MHDVHKDAPRHSSALRPYLTLLFSQTKRMGLEQGGSGGPLDKGEQPKTLKEELASINGRVENDLKKKSPMSSVYDYELVNFSKRLATEQQLSPDQVGVLVKNMLALRNQWAIEKTMPEIRKALEGLIE